MYTHIYIYIYIYIYTSMYVYIYIYMYTYTHDGKVMAYTAALQQLYTFVVRWVLRVSACVVLHVVCQRGLGV